MLNAYLSTNHLSTVHEVYFSYLLRLIGYASEPQYLSFGSKVILIMDIGKTSFLSISIRCLINLSSYPSLWLSWVDRIYIFFYISLSSRLSWVYRIYSYVLMQYFKPFFKFIFGGIGHIASSSNHEPRF
jgi:hypothetical protein